MSLFLSLSVVFSGILIIYHHVIYPLLLKKVLQKYDSNPKPIGLKDDELPSITLVIPAYNEQAFIADKIRNLACLDYPANKLAVIIACDGCSDATVNIAQSTVNEAELSHLSIDVAAFDKNRGKISVINSVTAIIQTDLLAFSDVSSLISIDALRIAAGRFADPSVGAVNGNYRLLNPGNSGESDYWRYQSTIKRGEECFGSVMGAHGAFYVVRTKLFNAVPVDTINDDFIIPMRIVEAGYRVVYEDRINAVELECSDDALNWHRRIRIGMGNMQQIIRLRGLFHPRFKGVSFTFFSGKGLRVLMPFLMIYCWVASGALAFNALFFLLLFSSQSLIYAIAAVVWIKGDSHCHRIGKAIFYLVSGHLANMIGSIKYFAK